MLRKIALFLALAAGSAAPLAGSAQAAIGDGALGLSAAAAQLAPVQKVQYVYGGQNYCFYPNGWRGPGFYWCGYGASYGVGWGGGYGWNGWGGGGVYHPYAGYGVYGHPGVYGHGYGWNGGGVYHGGYGYHGGGVYHGAGVYHGGYHGGVYRR
jgi:hypothetical protein